MRYNFLSFSSFSSLAEFLKRFTVQKRNISWIVQQCHGAIDSCHDYYWIYIGIQADVLPQTQPTQPTPPIGKADLNFFSKFFYLRDTIFLIKDQPNMIEIEEMAPHGIKRAIWHPHGMPYGMAFLQMAHGICKWHQSARIARALCSMLL